MYLSQPHHHNLIVCTQADLAIRSAIVKPLDKLKTRSSNRLVQPHCLRGTAQEVIPSWCHQTL